MSSYFRTFLAFFLAALGGSYVLSSSQQGRSEGLVKIRDTYMEFPGRLYAQTYRTHGERYAGHHAITYDGGGAAGRALIRTPVPDRRIAEVLDQLGFQSRGGIDEAAWSQRFDRRNPAPDTVAEGDPLEVLVRWGRRDWVSLESLLEDQGAPADLDLRFQDNRRWIRMYGSGCVICLSSCPGAKIGNRHYSMRQNEFGPMAFLPREEDLPPDGTPVLIRMGKPGTLRAR